MLKEIVFVPIRQKDQLVTSISKFAQLEANILKTKYKLIIAGTYEDWQVEGVEYTNTVFTTKDYALGGWSERWNQLAKYVNNDRLFYFHSPFPCLEFYNHTFVKGFVFPKIMLRLHGGPGEVAGLAALYSALLPSMLFPTLMGSKAAVANQKKYLLKAGIVPAKFGKDWYVHHPAPIYLDEIDKAEAVPEEFPTIQLATIHMYPVIVRPDRLLPVMQKLYESGVNFKGVLNIVDEYGADDFKNLPYLLYNNKPEREKYYSEIKSRHIFLCFYAYHTGGVTFLEMIYAGMVGVFWEAEYVHEKLPGYPFIVKTENEAVAMIKWIIDNFDEAKAKMEPFKKYIKDQYNPDAWGNRLLEVVKDVETKLFKRGNDEV